MTSSGKSSGMTEGLRKILGDIAQLSVEPDADVEFLTTLQQGIIGYMRNKMAQVGQQGGAAMQGGPGGPDAGGQPGPGMGTPQSPSPLGGGMQGIPGQPAADELNRLMGSQSQVA